MLRENEMNTTMFEAICLYWFYIYTLFCIFVLSYNVELL